MSEDFNSSDDDTFAPRPEHELPSRDKEEAKADRALGGPAFVDFKKQIYEYINTQYAEEEEENAQIKEDSIEDLMLDGLAMHVETFKVLEELFEGDEDNITSIIEISRDSELNSAFEEIFLSKKGSRIGYKLRDKRGVALIFKLNALNELYETYDERIVNDIMIVEGMVMKTQAKVIKISVNCSAARFEELVEAGAFLVKWNNLISKERLIILYSDHLRQMCRENIVFKSILDVHNDKPVARRYNTDEQAFNEILYHLDSFNRLHNDQKIAVKESLSAENYYLIHGPPGTGKTLTLLVILEALAKSKKRVLLCSEANNPIDNVLARFAKTSTFTELGLKLPGKIVRLGHRTLIADECKNYTLGNQVREHFKGQTKISKKEVMDVQKRFIQDAKFVFSTQCSTFRRIVRDHYTTPNYYFDYVLIEEASQSFLGFSLMAISMAKRVIFAGDHKQLPPVIKEEHMKATLEKSLFERLVDLRGRVEPDIKVYKLLGTQFRMNNLLIETSSRRYYDNRITSHAENADITLESFRCQNGKSIPRNRPLIWIDQPSLESNYSPGKIINKSEIVLILRLLEDLLLNMKISPEKIGIITSYYSQREAILHAVEEHEKFSDTELKKLLEKKLLISTVDSFQGREKEVVIYASTRANVRHQIGFLKDHRRFNVAITRAKRCLIFIGSIETLISNHNYPMVTLHETVKNKGLFLKWNPQVEELFVKENDKWVIYEQTVVVAVPGPEEPIDDASGSNSGSDSDGDGINDGMEDREEGDGYQDIHEEDTNPTGTDDQTPNSAQNTQTRSLFRSNRNIPLTLPDDLKVDPKKLEVQGSNQAAKRSVSVAKVTLDFAPTPRAFNTGLTRKQRSSTREKTRMDRIKKRGLKTESKEVIEILEEKSELMDEPLTAALLAKKPSKMRAKKKPDSTTNTITNLEAGLENDLASKFNGNDMAYQICILINKLRREPNSLSEAIKKRLTTFESFSFFNSAGKLRGSVEGEYACMEALVALEMANSHSELEVDESLNRCAQEHSDYLCKFHVLTHNGPHRTNLQSRVKMYGLTPGIVSQCIAVKCTNALDCVLAWIIDDGDVARLNRRSLLSKYFSKIGIGYNKEGCAVVVVAGDKIDLSRLVNSRLAMDDDLPEDMSDWLKVGPPGAKEMTCSKTTLVHGTKKSVTFTAKYNMGLGDMTEGRESFEYDKRGNKLIFYHREAFEHSKYKTSPAQRTSTANIVPYTNFKARISAQVRNTKRFSTQTLFILALIEFNIAELAAQRAVDEYMSQLLDKLTNKNTLKSLKTSIIDNSTSQVVNTPDKVVDTSLTTNPNAVATIPTSTNHPNPIVTPKANSETLSKANKSVREFTNLINLLRSNPKSFVEPLKKRSTTYSGQYWVDSIGNICHSVEGRYACLEACTALEKLATSPKLELDEDLIRCAQDRCYINSRGGDAGLKKHNQNELRERFSKYGNWEGQVGEISSSGCSIAKDILMGLLVGDGDPSRDNRCALFLSHYDRIGVATNYSQDPLKSFAVLVFAKAAKPGSNYKFPSASLEVTNILGLPEEMRYMPEGGKSMTCTRQVTIEGDVEIVKFTATCEMEDGSNKVMIKEYYCEISSKIAMFIKINTETIPASKVNTNMKASKVFKPEDLSVRPQTNPRGLPAMNQSK